MMEQHQHHPQAQSRSYEQFPLLNDLILFEQQRTNALRLEGKCQIDYPLSNRASWLRTIFLWRGRALDRMAVPFGIVMAHAIFYIILEEHVLSHDHALRIKRELSRWEIFFSFVLNSTLALLLVFRLNRAAERFWIARQYWGDIVAYSRSLISGILTHSCNNNNTTTTTTTTPGCSEAAIRYLLVWVLATKDLLRSSSRSSSNQWDVDTYAGLLTPVQVQQFERYHHSPMIIMDRVRASLKREFMGIGHDGQYGSYCNNDDALNMLHKTIVFDRFEEQLNSLIWVAGGMERIKNTPLPMVYVSHLRTFLLINLLLFPWVFGVSWSTLPMVAICAFATLGIESAAAEVECPFQLDRVNALNMNAYVLNVIQMVQEQLQNQADEILQNEDDAATATVAL